MHTNKYWKFPSTIMFFVFRAPFMYQRYITAFVLLSLTYYLSMINLYNWVKWKSMATWEYKQNCYSLFWKLKVVKESNLRFWNLVPAVHIIELGTIELSLIYFFVYFLFVICLRSQSFCFSNRIFHSVLHSIFHSVLLVTHLRVQNSDGCRLHRTWTWISFFVHSISYSLHWWSSVCGIWNL